MATSFSSRSFSNDNAACSQTDIVKEIQASEIVIAELSSLSSSKSVYQKSGNIFFRTSIPKALQSTQKRLDSTKADMQRLTRNDAILGSQAHNIITDDIPVEK